MAVMALQAAVRSKAHRCHQVHSKYCRIHHSGEVVFSCLIVFVPLFKPYLGSLQHI